jgi:hypothetical protein
VITILCKDCIQQREMPNDKYNYLYEMRTLCIMNNMVFLQCDNCKRVDVVSMGLFQENSVS